MSRIPKWKLEKTKVKVVFRLQFHATHIPQTGWDKLFVSFISDETGRVTAKTNKANVRNGTCKWADPIYETTRLLQDPSAKKYEDKLYKLVVAMGTSRSSLLGETFINLADHADALKPTSIPLPLEGYDFGTILHVSIQLLTSKTGFREFEQQRETREKGFHLISNPAQEPVRKLDKANGSGRFKQESGELYPLEEMDEASGDFEDSATGIDGSSCTSESIHAEKGEISGPSGSGTLKITINGNQNTHDESPHHLVVHGWSSDFSVDNKLSSLYDENTKLRGCLEIAESSILEMKTELNSLKLVAEELGAETQRLTHQFTSELVSGEALYEEVSALKSECSNVKDEFEVLRHYKRMLHLNGRRAESLHNPDSFHGIKEWADKPESQSQCLEGLMFLDKKVKLLRSKMQVRCHEKDVDLISDFEGIDFVLQNLKQRVMLSSSSSSTQAAGVKQIIPLQTLLDQELENKKIMNERICKLLTELEESKSERETLNRKMNQKVLHYDAFILELEERNLQALSELESVKSMHLSSLSTISALQTEIEKITRDTNDKFVKLSEEKWSLESVNKELEKRVVASEAVLKRIRSTYSTAVIRLQKDLELLSAQVLSIFEMNENLAKKSLDEAPKMLYCDNHEFLDVGDRSNIFERCQEPCPDLNAGKLRNYAIPRSEESCYLEENAEQLHELHALNLHLHVLVEVLKETLLEKRLLERDMKEKMNELSKSKGLLIHNIEVAFDEIRVLREDVAKFSAKSEDLLAEKSTLETKFLDACDENSSVLKNLAECERLIADLKISKMRHVEEISTLENSLKEESFQKSCLKAELDEKSSALNNLEMFFDFLAERLRIMRSNVEPYITQMNTHNFKLSRALVSLDKELEKSDYLAIISQLEELQLVALKDVLELNGETKEREKENDSLRVLLKEMSSELEEIRSKFDLSNSVLENLRSALRTKAESEEKLIGRNKDLTSKLTIMEYKLQDAYNEKGDISKIQEESERAQKKITNLKVEKETMMESTFQLEKELVNLKDQLYCCSEDLKSEREAKAKLKETISILESEKSGLENLLQHHEEQQRNQDDELLSLRDKVTEKSRELSILNETLRSKNDELHDEKLLSVKMENKIEDLTLKLSSFNELNSELSYLRQQIIDLESSKSPAEKLEAQISTLQSKVTYLDTELCKARERLGCSRDELHSEREMREKLQATVSDFTSLLNEKQKEVLYFSNQKAELTNLEQQIVTLESEKSALDKILTNSEKRVSELGAEISSLHSQLQSEKEIRLSELTQFRQQVLDLEMVKEEREREVSELTSLLNKKEQQLISFEDREAELTALRQKVSELESEKEIRVKLESTLSEVYSLLEEKQQQLVLLREEISEAKSGNSELCTEISSLHSQLQYERDITSNELSHFRQQVRGLEMVKEEREREVSELTSLLNKKEQQLISFEDREAELTALRQKVSELESEKAIRVKLESTLSEVYSLLEEKQQQLVLLREEISEAKSGNSELCTEISSLHSQLQYERDITSSELSHFRQQVRGQEMVKEEREREVSELTSLLNKKELQLLSFENREAELTALRQKVSEMESDKAIRVKLESTLSEVSSLLEEKQQQLVFLREEISEAKSENSELGTEISNLHSQLHSERDLRSSESIQFQQQVLDLETVKKRREIEVSELTSLLNEKEQQLISFEEREEELTSLKQKVSELESEKDIRVKLESMLSEVSSVLDEKQQQLILLREGISDVKSENSELYELLLSTYIESTFVQTQYQKNMQELFSEFITIERRNTEIQKMGRPSNQFEEEMERLRSSKEEHEIAGIVLQSKIFEQYEQNQDLSKRLSEQILKAEEFKNLSIHLKNQIKEKRERDSPPGAVVESLRVAFIKEQCEVKVQELQVQLDISKKHGEDLLLKLQSALDEIELRKKNEASNARRNEEQSLKIVELESSKREFVKDFDEIKAELECSIISAECCKEEKSKVEASLRECTFEIEKLRDELQSVKSQLHTYTSKTLEEMSFQRDDRWVSANGSKENSSEDQRRERQNFRDGIKRLKQELEKMKEENLEIPISAQGEALLDPSLRGLEKELVKLELANQNLGMIFPSFQEIPGNGNALERVLALELELAEALQTKNKSDFIFQSSFLRQLGDEAAVLRSFRDINELIGDMLNTKGKHAAIESELKEMHSRYTQLSLRLAEVEGERQKLLMKLKNSRSPKKLQP